MKNIYILKASDIIKYLDENMVFIKSYITTKVSYLFEGICIRLINYMSVEKYKIGNIPIKYSSGAD